MSDHHRSDQHHSGPSPLTPEEVRRLLFGVMTELQRLNQAVPALTEAVNDLTSLLSSGQAVDRSATAAGGIVNGVQGILGALSGLGVSFDPPEDDPPPPRPRRRR
ncbi:MAG: hypothetical protein IT371_30525 [Deltaproteobacteria bacterium]|nr:hypothetical protein [Deltaproteobacteria bacterium]